MLERGRLAEHDARMGPEGRREGGRPGLGHREQHDAGIGKDEHRPLLKIWRAGVNASLTDAVTGCAEFD